MELTRWQRWRLLAFRLFAVRADRLNSTPTRKPYAPVHPGDDLRGTSNFCGTTRDPVSSAYV